MITGPHYVVIEGTNICDHIQVGVYTYIPKIFDTKEIAQAYIDDIVELRKRVDIRPVRKRVPISVYEYKEKYPKRAETGVN